MDLLKQRLQGLVRYKFFYPLLVIGGILLANGLYVTNHYIANPTYLRSGLINSQQPGPISGQYTIDPSDGFYAQALGHRAAVDFVHGHIPWWNHYEGVGAPLIGGLQSAALFPLEFLLVFPNGLFYFHLALELIAALGTYYLLKRLKCNEAASVVGAIVFGLNGTFAWIAHTIFNPIAFLPWLLLGIEMIRESVQNRKPRGWLLLALAISCTLYAGFPETGFIDMMFAGLWALARTNTLPRTDWWRYLGKLVLAGLVGLVLASPILLAFAEYLPYANVGLHAGNTSNLVLPYIGLAGLILPYVFGPIFAYWGYDPSLLLYSWWAVVGGFLSISLLPLAIVGLASRMFRRIDRLFLLGWILFCVFASYKLLGVNQIAGHIPFLASAAFSRYFPPTYEFAAVMLAAMAITSVWQKSTGEDRRMPRLVIGTTVFCWVAILGAVLVSWHEYHVLHAAHAPHLRIFYYISILWGFGVVSLIGLGLLLSRRRFARYAVLAVLLLDVGVMYVVPMFSAPRHATIDLKPVKFLRANLGNQRMFSLGPIQPNYGTYYRVASANINDVPQPRTYSAYIAKYLDDNVNPITFTGTNSADGKKRQPPQAFLDNMYNYEAIGVKYVITFPELFSQGQIQSHGLKLVSRSDISEIYQLPNPKPYISTLKGACVTTAPDRDTVVAMCSQPSTLLRLEQFLPGWTATVDGKQAKIGAYQGLMQTIEVPTGKHTVRFYFEPPHIRLTYVAVAIVLGSIAFGYCVPAGRRRSMYGQAATAIRQALAGRWD